MIASIPILLNLKNKKNTNIIIPLIIIALSLLPWIKREGIFFNIFILISIFFSDKLSKKEIFFIFIFCVMALISLILIRTYYYSNFNLDFDTKGAIGSLLSEIINLKLTLYKIKLIIYEIVKASIKYPLFMLCFIFLICQIFIKKNVEITFFILSILFIVAVHLIPEGFVFIRQVLDRLIFQTTGFYLVYLVLSLNKLKFKI